MISSISVRNFQSLHEVDLELAGFTVIIGPSSSGKSALTRAIRTLTSNKRGSDFISTGERISIISATTDMGTVSLKRGKGVNDNEYRIIPSDPSVPESTFTKLGGETPPEVSDFIGIDSSDPINYAGQFDKPYLLDESPATVARALGQLTNVNVIFEAARESNRRKLTANQDFKAAAAKLESIRATIPEYANLKQQQDSLAKAEALLAEAHDTEQTINRLQALISTCLAAQESISSTEQQRSPLPSLTALGQADLALSTVTALLRDISTVSRQQAAANSDLAAANSTLVEAQAAYIHALQQAGTCPTCGSDTTHLHPSSTGAAHGIE